MTNDSWASFDGPDPQIKTQYEDKGFTVLTQHEAASLRMHLQHSPLDASANPWLSPDFRSALRKLGL